LLVSEIQKNGIVDVHASSHHGQGELVKMKAGVLAFT